MALQLSKELLSGVLGNYWKIISINHSPSLFTRVNIGLFIDSAASGTNKQPIDVIVIRLAIPLTLLEITNKNIIAAAYDRLKLLASFSGAQDV